MTNNNDSGGTTMTSADRRQPLVLTAREGRAVIQAKTHIRDEMNRFARTIGLIHDDDTGGIMVVVEASPFDENTGEQWAVMLDAEYRVVEEYVPPDAYAGIEVKPVAVERGTVVPRAEAQTTTRRKSGARTRASRGSTQNAPGASEGTSGRPNTPERAQGDPETPPARPKRTRARRDDAQETGTCPVCGSDAPVFRHAVARVKNVGPSGWIGRHIRPDGQRACTGSYRTPKEA